MREQKHEKRNKKLYLSLFLPLTTLFLITILAFFKIYALIPVLLALLLLSILRNVIFSFFIALFISSIIFGDLNYFFILILKQIDYTVLAILTIGGVFGVVLAGEGSSDFYIWLRKKAKTFRDKKLIVSFVALFNFFSSTISVTATNSLLSEDFKSKNVKEEDKKDLLKIVLLLSNVTTVLVPFSLSWLFYSKFTKDINFSFFSVLPFLFYPMVAILHTIFNIVLKEGKSEFSLEKREFNTKKLITFVILPILFIYPFLFVEGFHIWLYETSILTIKPIFSNKTLVFGSFVLGTLFTFVLYIFNAAISTKINANLKNAIRSIEEGRKIIQKALNELESGKKRFTVGKTGINPEVFKHLLACLNIDAHRKKYLKDAEYFHDLEPFGVFPRLETSFTNTIQNIVEGVSRFTKLFLEGMKNLLDAVLIFIGVLGIKDLIIGLGVDMPRLNSMSSFQPILPFFVFILAASIGYHIGTAWGTFAICFTLLIIPLNGSVSPFILNLAISALISASVFANQVSRVADNVIITSSLTGFSSEDISDSIKRNALICFSISAVLYLISSVIAKFCI